MKEIKAPHLDLATRENIRLFLGGSIDMGQCELWQEEMVKEFAGFSDLAIFNPRGDNWDNSCEQHKDNIPFRTQVRWEILQQKDAHVIIYYFVEDSKSPVTMMELGLFITSSAFVHVYCPPGFYRKGNVDLVCEYWDVPVYETREDLIKGVKQTLTEVYGLQEK